MARRTSWTDAEIAYLRENANRLGDPAMGRHLGCSAKTVARARAKFGAHRDPAFSRRLQAQDQRGEKNNNWKGGVASDNMRYRQRQIARHPERVAARRAVRAAVKSGRLEREPCENCGSTNRLEAHHEDYDQPLVVRWLCMECHRAHHRMAQAA